MANFNTSGKHVRFADSVMDSKPSSSWTRAKSPPPRQFDDAADFGNSNTAGKHVRWADSVIDKKPSPSWTRPKPPPPRQYNDAADFGDFVPQDKLTSMNEWDKQDKEARAKSSTLGFAKAVFKGFLKKDSPSKKN